MRPLHTAPAVPTDRSLRKSSSRVVLQVQDSGPLAAECSSRGRGGSSGGAGAAAAAGAPRAPLRGLDTLLILLLLAVGLSVVGFVFVNRLITNSSAADSAGDVPEDLLL
jgi:hypothetical protein